MIFRVWVLIWEFFRGFVDFEVCW